jgi:hypothetical protein
VSDFIYRVRPKTMRLRLSNQKRTTVHKLQLLKM